jgi:polar amino acid transport system substrate-binding protein
MKREIAILGMIVCIVVGLLVGWFIPGLFTAPTPTPLIDQIKTRGHIIVGTSADYPPFENKTYPAGEIVGFDIDVSQMIADELGVTLEMKDMDFDSLIGACRAGTIDMIAAAMTYNADRAKQLAPSITYIFVRQVVIVKNSSSLTTITSLNDLVGKDVGCQSGTVMQTELNAITGINVFAYASVDILIQTLDAEGIDAAYVDGPIYDAWADGIDLRIIYSSGEEPLALWCKQGEQALLYEINKVIFESYQDGSMYTLINKWFGNVTA